MRSNWIPIALLALISGCTRSTDVTEFTYSPEVNVFAFFILNNQQKIIHIEESYRVTDYVPENRGISDAEVMVQSKNQQVRFIHRVNGYYEEEAALLNLVEGETYHLHIQMADGRRVKGQCTIPHPPEIKTPQLHNPVHAYSALEIEWAVQVPARRYEISVRGNISGYSAQAGTDSLQMSFYPFLLAQPDIYVLKVTALEQNYYDYTRVGEDHPPIFHLEGAMGVFGAISYDEVIISAQ